MIKTTAKRIAAASLSLALLFQATPSFATPTYDDQIETLETKIRQFDNQIVESMEKIATLNAEVKEAEARVVKTQAEITEVEKSYNRTVELSKERITNIQANGSAQSNFIEVLLTSEGISDFVQKTTALIQIMTSDQQLADTLSAKQEELETLEADLEADLALIEANKAEAVAKQAEIEKNKETVQTELANVEAAKQAAEEEAARQAELAAQQAAAAAATATATADNATSTETTTSAPAAATTTTASSSSNSSSSTETSKSESSSSSSISASASAIIAEAKKYLGTPYVWGGTTPSGFDCSGFTSYVYKKAGISLPRTSRAQQNYGTQVSLSNVQPGDLVFMGKPAYHVGIYIGGGQYIHAPQTGDVVKISTFKASSFSSATRVLN
ncbi:MAG: NlpC/P60 family protein [Bacillus sp. (in: firmicutes)]